MNEEIELILNLEVQKDDEGKKKKRVKSAQDKKAKEEAKIAEHNDPKVLVAKWKSFIAGATSDLERTRLTMAYESYVKLEVVRDAPTRAFSKAEAMRMYLKARDINRDRILRKMVDDIPPNYRLIQTTDQFEELIELFKYEKLVAFDVETTGVDVYNDDLVGMSFTLPKADIHVYIPVQHDEGVQLPIDYVLNGLKTILQDKHLKKVLHNAKFDFHIMRRYGIRCRGLLMDTMVAMWVLNENEMSYRLKDLATKYHKYLGIKKENDTFDELFGKNCKFNTVPLQYALAYGAKDTHITYLLYLFIEEQLSKAHLKGARSIYYELENDLIEVSIEMEQTGFCVDFDFAKKYAGKLSRRINRISKVLLHTFGELNFNSPTQLAKKFYDEMGLPDVSKKRSTDAETLEKLSYHHKGIALLLKYRELTKLHGTYVDKLPHIVKGDQRVHGQFNQSATVTGRYASKEPNLQNLPQEARKLFISPDGWVILGSDFSQIEPRVLAHMANDRNLMQPYLEGSDLYATLASKVFKQPIEKCGDGSKYRKMMKTGLLAVMYGTSMYTLSVQLGISMKEAEQFIEDFYESYPDVEQFIYDTWERAKKNEYVETMFGRKRRFTGHRQDAIAYDRVAKEICEITGTKKVPSDFWKIKEIPYMLKRQFQDVKGKVERVRRMAVNARIQGSAADIMKKAMQRLHDYVITKEWRVAGTVHDEALLYVPLTITKEEVAEIEQCMTGSATLSIPMKVDVEFSLRWGEGVNKNAWFAQAS